MCNCEMFFWPVNCFAFFGADLRIFMRNVVQMMSTCIGSSGDYLCNFNYGIFFSIDTHIPQSKCELNKTGQQFDRTFFRL